jgi:hypothetical protein
VLLAGGVALPWTARAATAPHPVAVIPIELEDGNNYATVRIGQVHLRAVIDTGAAGEVGIASDLLAKLHVRFTGSGSERTDESGHTFQGREFRIPAMQLGGATFRDVPGYERPPASADAGESPPFDVLIGPGFLRHYTLVVDYPQQRIELYKAASARKVCGTHTTAIVPSRDGIMFSTVRTDAGAMNLGWDSGLAFSVVQQAVVTARSLTLREGLYSTRRFTLEQFDAGAMDAQLDAGPMDLASIDMPTVADVDGLIGFNFFARHRVCFDYTRGAVSVQPDVPGAAAAGAPRQ